jgi:RNA polymerase-binding transcription factor DksA
MDEGGYQRLKNSLFYLKLEMDQLVPKMLSMQKQNNAIFQKMVEHVRSQIAREYEKTIYILELMDSEESEIPLKIKENDYGLKFSDFEALLSIETHKHKAFNEIKKDTLRKMFGNN